MKIELYYSWLLDQALGNPIKTDTKVFEPILAKKPFIEETVREIESFFSFKTSDIEVALITKWATPYLGISKPCVIVMQDRLGDIEPQKIAVTIIHEIAHIIIMNNVDKQVMMKVHEQKLYRNHLLLYALLKEVLSEHDWQHAIKTTNKTYKDIISLSGTKSLKDWLEIYCPEEVDGR